MNTKVNIFCAGLIGWDTIAHTQMAMKPGSDLPGYIETNLGGVIANIAVALKNKAQNKIDLEVILLSAVGDDQRSKKLLSCLSKEHNINCDYVIREQGSPDGYVAIESKGALFGAVSSSYQLEKSCTEIFEPFKKKYLTIKTTSIKNFVIIDSNLTNQTINYLVNDQFFDSIEIVIACASPFKAKKVRPLLMKRNCIIYANLEESSKILGKKINCSSKAAESLFDFGAKQAIVTNGKNNVSSKSINCLATQTPEPALTNRITGAGDTFLAAHFISKIINPDLSEEEHLKIANSESYIKIT